MRLLRFAVLLALSPALTLVGGGCAREAAKVEGPRGKPTQVGRLEGHDHSGWWCDEHGVPEEVCAQCNARLAAEFKKKGDWCKDHDRPDSQCFVCHPELKERFAAQYRAKYGKEPPPLEEEKDARKSNKG
jgi:hypothetical protein